MLYLSMASCAVCALASHSSPYMQAWCTHRLRWLLVACLRSTNATVSPRTTSKMLPVDVTIPCQQTSPGLSQLISSYAHGSCAGRTSLTLKLLRLLVRIFEIGHDCRVAVQRYRRICGKPLSESSRVCRRLGSLVLFVYARRVVPQPQKGRSRLTAPRFRV